MGLSVRLALMLGLLTLALAGCKPPDQALQPAVNTSAKSLHADIAGNAVLRKVATTSINQHDQVLFIFDGHPPGFNAEYMQVPLMLSASGEETKVKGTAFLALRLLPAQAHDEAGRLTVNPTEGLKGKRVVVEIKRVEDFEGQVIYVIGLREKRPFTVNRSVAVRRIGVRFE